VPLVPNMSATTEMATELLTQLLAERKSGTDRDPVEPNAVNSSTN